MTSVPNRLLPLSGSKIFLFAIAITILLIPACKTQEESVKKDITDKSISEEIDTLFVEKDIVFDSILEPIDSFRLKDYYNIAYILPFYLDSLSQDSLANNPDYFYKDAEMSAKFYLGAKLALDSLKQLGLNANVHVFDSKNQLGRMVELKKSGALDSMDLIIGPIYNSNIRYLAKWNKDKEIILVNPLSPTAELASENPLFIQINPSINTHIENLFELVKLNFAKKNKVIINRPVENELRYQNHWKELAETHNIQIDSIKKAVEFPKVPTDSIAFNYFILDDEDNKLLRENQLMEDTLFVNMLDEDSLNIIIVNTIDRTFISKLNRNLFKLCDKYEILVVGLPVWSSVEDFRLDYVQKFNLHYSSDYFIDSSFYHSPLYDHSVEAFGMHPNLFFIKGFDISMWMGKSLMKYGLDMVDTSVNNMYLEGIHNNFHLEYIYNTTEDSISTVNYLENKHVQLLNIKDYVIQDVRKTTKKKK